MCAICTCLLILIDKYTTKLPKWLNIMACPFYSSAMSVLLFANSLMKMISLVRLGILPLIAQLKDQKIRIYLLKLPCPKFKDHKTN